MKSEALSAALRNKTPVIVLTGDRYIAHRALDAVKRRIVPDEAMRPVNMTVYEGKEGVADRVARTCRTSPVFAPRRLVILIDPPDLAALSDYCSAPATHACLVIVADKVDARTKTVQAIRRTGAIVQFDTPKEHELPQWLAHEAASLKIPITPDACILIVQTIGSDLPLLLDALERCHLSAPRGSQILTEHVQNALCLSRKFSVFDLTDACAVRDLSRALHVLENLIINREDPVRLMHLLIGHIRKLMLCVAQCELGQQTGDSIAAALKMHPFAAGKLLQQSRTLNADRAREMHEEMYQLAVRCAPGTKAMGQSPSGDRLYLEQTVIRMCS